MPLCTSCCCQSLCCVSRVPYQLHTRLRPALCCRCCISSARSPQSHPIHLTSLPMTSTSWQSLSPGPATPGSHCLLICLGFSLRKHEVVCPRKVLPGITSQSSSQCSCILFPSFCLVTLSKYQTLPPPSQSCCHSSSFHSVLAPLLPYEASDKPRRTPSDKLPSL